MTRKIILAISLLAAAFAWAKPIDDAKQLYFNGRYAEAIDKLAAIVRSAPKDGTANYYLGMAYLAMQQPSKAKEPLEISLQRGVAKAAAPLATIAMDQYDMDLASDYIDEWEQTLRKEKKEIPADISQARARIVNMRNMLDRVEKIEIIDSIVVDKEDFFTRYRLGEGAGYITDASALPDGLTQYSPSMVFMPQDSTEIFWAMPDNSGKLRLASAIVLDDGTVEEPVLMSDDLNEGGNADFPFFAPDGATFYFANDGENSIGGYDIFMSRRAPDGSTFQPQNMGMPYNSPFDDYMLAIDEETGRGWWATDRNQIPGKVTIYVFKPNETRVNYDPDDPKIADYAFIRSVRRDPNSLPDLAPTNAIAHDYQNFILSLGQGRVYTSLDDFDNPQARDAMKQYLDRMELLEKMQRQVDDLRIRYAKGDRSVSSDIISLEQRILAGRALLRRLKNSAIAQEK